MNRALLLTVVGLLLVGCPDDVLTSEECDACDSCVLETLQFDSAVHTEEPIDWGTTPPVGGPHDPCWGDWDVYASALDPRHWVHNLEHGGIVYLYDCPDGCADDVATLTALHAANPAGTVLVTPYEGLGSRFAAVAWGKRMLLDCADEGALQQFYVDHVDQAPESVTAGAPAGCMP